MRKRILPFAVAGALGFGVDAGVLLLVSGILGAFDGRVVSFLCAVLVTWAVNRNFTFADRAARTGRHRELLRYLLAMLPGSGVNWLTYTVLVSLLAQTPLVLVLAVGAGSLAGMATNFAAANWLVFRVPR